MGGNVAHFSSEQAHMEFMRLKMEDERRRHIEMMRMIPSPSYFDYDPSLIGTSKPTPRPAQPKHLNPKLLLTRSI